MTTGLTHMGEMAFARGEPRDQVQEKKASLVLRSCFQPVTQWGNDQNLGRASCPPGEQLDRERSGPERSASLATHSR